MLKILTEPKDEFAEGSVVTLGNFDGVHRGHEALLKRLYAIAQEKKLPMAIVLFEPQPQEVLQSTQTVARLTSWVEKVVALQALFNTKEIQGYILTLHFNEALANLSPDDFLHQVLLHGLNMKHLLVGEDFRFGHKRAGNIELLRQDSNQHGHDYTVETFPAFEWQGQRVSSTRIREALAAANLDLAKDLLGRPYTITGVVEKGDGKGRQLGFRTANIALERACPALLGVFAVKVHGINAEPLYGAANLGARPTVDGKRTFLEVYIFDFEEDIYDRQVTVEFVKYLRPEQKFESLEQLKAQIAKDVEEGRRVFKQ
jgi:riboflavin kinase/FMN adenylyltransferase